MSTQTLPEDIAKQLDALRDIHLPNPVSWWPLAPGWWVLAAALCIGALLLGIFIRRRRHSVQANALRELAWLRTQQETQAHAAGDNAALTPALAESLSELLRRVAIQLPNGRKHATQHGKAWSDYLMGTPGGLPSNIAQFLAVGPYAGEHKTDTRQTDTTSAKRSEASTLSAREIFVATERWIRSHT